jgi:putative transposase
VDHVTVHRWAIKVLPTLGAISRTRKRPVGSGGRMDETYIKADDQWKYLYRAVDRVGDTAAIESIKQDACVDIIIMRQSKYLINIVEQDHRAIKRITKPMMGFNHFGVPESSSLELRRCT